MAALLESTIPGIPVRRGKVRDVYDFGETLLLVATDRISAFDWILPTGIPDKGRILTQISKFWFDFLQVNDHLLSLDATTLSLPQGTDVESLRGRSMVVRKTEVVPIECVVRGYLAGSGWKEYRQEGTLAGESLPMGLKECDRLPQTQFTPATKAESGHDENISIGEMEQAVGIDLADDLQSLSLHIYERASEYALTRGIIIADTKFEFGLVGDEIVLIDEVLTPDSSRFWPADQYSPGKNQPSFDKQFVRDWLETTGWDKNSVPPIPPQDIVDRTRAKYVEAYERLTGKSFEWK
ncbi:phosphoribosylaminoimidazolesuccinocarboxamide synthase [Planctomicrobium piriforme]|uniref:Phosphoribosylaminoimidazole-succinocarboxamide synthase n=1 Tax=Planctomicrobium piriforme TaxID=1576369 RepID=A0A1I3FT86_9PLAN|nr:phosphoribosylaminoimidazolesuccinocarboxamide synthase [Planctomicrobium piriforme]SFI14141.1 phosphoribosylaminoimidazole-succinocarboxamide synthase [Planctomicrobium piriforme]